jgi:hypothetical protein
MTSWSRKRHEIVHEFEVADAPELQDSESERRMVLLPRKVTVYQKPGTNLARGACIEGRQVKRDGDLAGSKMILAGMSSNRFGYRATPPGWLNELLADLGLEWDRGTDRSA